MNYTTHSESDTLSLGNQLAKMLNPGDTVLLNGDLGTGKSVLARGIARGLGVVGAMPSPTFTLMMPYEGFGGAKVYHFDLYRIADIDEYYAAGLDEFIASDGVALVEWPEMAGLSVTPALDIHLERLDDETRQIAIENRGVEGYRAEALERWAAE